MAQCINRNQINRSLVAQWYPALRDKTGPTFLPLVGLTTDRQASKQAVSTQASRRNMGGFQKFLNSPQVELSRFLFCLILLQCYYSVTTVF